MFIHRLKNITKTISAIKFYLLYQNVITSCYYGYGIGLLARPTTLNGVGTEKNADLVFV